MPSTVSEDKPTPGHIIMEFLKNRKNTGDKKKTLKVFQTEKSRLHMNQNGFTLLNRNFVEMEN